MKRSFLLATVLLSALAAAQRLPEIAVPDNYKLTFAPDFTKDNFTGEETIQVRVLKPTSQIVLNSAEIEFKDVSITSSGVTQKAKVTLAKKKETATLGVDKPIQPGPATIQIGYTGILNNQLRGLYLSKANGRKYAVTQFEATDARRAYPSFDEPAYKATFDVSVVANKGDTGISNGKIISDTPGRGAGKHTIRFATTPKMSSYLVALAVGDFEYIEGSADGIPIRVWTTPGKKQQGSFALEAAENFMRYFNHYFEIKYPFEKLDIIAFPDFAAGAMENTAAITYRESYLLLDDSKASVDAHKLVASVLAHEMAHMWFGDLVTMQWWDDVWLNEGFANWMQTKPVAAWKPEWNIELDDVETSGGALNVDSLANTRPIHQAAETPEQITELFDGIAYNKAAAVLQMLEAYLGPSTFRAGVNQYLKKHAYGNATADDFWSTLAAVSNKPVDRIMATFVKQPGAPMVAVKAQCTNNATTVTLSQRRYFYDRNLFSAGNDELWQIPVCMKAGEDGKNQEKCELLTKKEDSFTLPGCAPWVMTNAGAAGFYRSGYEPEAVRAMSRNLETALAPAERIRLLSDEWASVRVGRHPIGYYLALADGLQAERNRGVMDQLTTQLEYIGDYLLTDADREPYQRWVRDLLTPSAKELGWQPKAGESDDRKTMRAQVLYTLGHTGRDPQLLAEAATLAQQALDNPQAVDGTIAPTVFRLAAQNGDASLYDKIMNRMQQVKASPQEYYVLMKALSRFSDPKLLERTLQFALTPEVRTQDAPHLISGVMANPAGSRIAWDFVRTRWAEIEKMMAGFNTGSLVTATGSFCDAGLRDEVKDFFSTHKVPASERTLRQALERVNYCVDLKSQQANQLASWLERRGSSAGR
jgi:aminopeptidase N